MSITIMMTRKLSRVNQAWPREMSFQKVYPHKLSIKLKHRKMIIKMAMQRVTGRNKSEKPMKNQGSIITQRRKNWENRNQQVRINNSLHSTYERLVNWRNLHKFKIRTKVHSFQSRKDISLPRSMLNITMIPRRKNKNPKIHSPRSNRLHTFKQLYSTKMRGKK